MKTEITPHKCHAIGCEKPVPPCLLMCRTHWRQVPKELQQAVLASYRPGQEITKQPSAEYLQAARAAVLAVKNSNSRKGEI